MEKGTSVSEVPAPQYEKGSMKNAERRGWEPAASGWARARARGVGGGAQAGVFGAWAWCVFAPGWLLAVLA